MTRTVRIGDRLVGDGQPTFIIAEMSANHGGDLGRAREIIQLAADAGADAIKLQTYTADTMTLDSSASPFRVSGGLWDGYTLYQLYEEAHTPWAWHETLFEEAARAGLICFSSPFDATAVDFLEQFAPPVYKLASFEVTDLPLVRKIASTGRPVIMSTGMANLEEITACIQTLRSHGCPEIIVLRCVSAYPADPADFDLATIPDIARRFDVVAGLSDHSMGHTVAVASVALGGHVIEKHFIRHRSDGGPDASFSMEPEEFSALVGAVREAEAAVGAVRYGAGVAEAANITFRRSCFVARDIKAGERFSAESVRVIRPGHGLEPDALDRVIGRRATRDIAAATPLDWSMVDSGDD
ncbi:MAG: pseudaminic acid synthase [Myxococcota bacterium]|jgi:N-acetylneuraminate synthase|nr:pseudaminic acid synthase [Myxococcota bacterium]